MFWSEFGPSFGGFFHPELEAHSQLPGNVWTEYWNRTPKNGKFILESMTVFLCISTILIHLHFPVNILKYNRGVTNFNMFFQQGILATKKCLKFSLPLCIYASVCRYVIWNAEDIFHQPPSHHWGLTKKPTCTIHVRSASRWNVPKEMMLWSGIYCPPRDDGPKATTIPKEKRQ